MLQYKQLILVTQSRQKGCVECAINRQRHECHELHLCVCSRGGRSLIFRPRLRSCSKIFECESGAEFFFNLRIRILFKIRPPSMQPIFSNFCTLTMTSRSHCRKMLLLVLPKMKWTPDPSPGFNNLLTPDQW